MPDFNFSSPLYKSYVQTHPPVAPSGPTPGAPPDFMTLFLRALQAHQASQDQNMQGRNQLEVDKTFGRHLDAGGQPITGDQNPFTNGMFTPAAQRQQQMQNMGPSVGIPSRTDAASNPYAFGPTSPAVPDAPPQMGGGFAPSTRPIHGGFEGMVNPQAPDATKYSDSNMFTAKPRKTTYTPQAQPKRNPFSFQTSYPSLK